MHVVAVAASPVAAACRTRRAFFERKRVNREALPSALQNLAANLPIVDAALERPKTISVTAR